jgi:hypothetical protein
MSLRMPQKGSEMIDGDAATALRAWVMNIQ